jgi:cyclopropane-fatty-acyl-phospholipid synthase
MVHTLGKEVRNGAVHLRDGDARTTFGTPRPGELEASVTVRDPRFYDAIALRGTIGFGESYRDGYWSTDDLTGLIRICIQNAGIMDTVETRLARLTRPLHKLYHALRDNTRRGSRENIAAHYDLGNDFYRLFLDESMTYSCAFFEREDMTLEEAQTAKIDRICRKLALEPRDHLLEIGTGWGALAVHAAKNYGCRVTTTTISEEQLAFARERVAREGLEGRVTVLGTDYRELEGRYDKLVSVEMIEAVGAPWFDTFFGKCSRLLRDDGLLLIQAITVREDQFERARDDVDFVKRYIFPGCCLLSVGAIAGSVARATDMGVCHLEDLTTHYARTLREWRARFLARRGEVLRLARFDEAFVRLWEFYLCYCEAGFLERHTRDVQVLLAKPLCRKDSVPIERVSPSELVAFA